MSSPPPSASSSERERSCTKSVSRPITGAEFDTSSKSGDITNKPPITTSIRHLDVSEPAPRELRMDAERTNLRRLLAEKHDALSRQVTRLPAEARVRVLNEQLEMTTIMALLPVIPDEAWERFKTLQAILSNETDEEDADLVQSAMIYFRAMAEVLNLWLQRPTRQEDRTNARRSNQTKKAQKNVAAATGKTCNLTGRRNMVEACHFVPNSVTRNVNNNGRFWAGLKCFISPQRVRELNALVNDPDRQGQNLLVLERSAHVYFGKAYISFKPVDHADDDSWLDMEFRYLSPSKDTAGNLSYRRAPNKMTVFCDHRLRDRQDDEVATVQWPKPTKSGAVIHLETSDPHKFPLLNYEIAKLAWYLNQVASMKAATDIIIPFFRREEDDDDQDEQTAAYEDEEVSTIGTAPRSSLSALKWLLIDNAVDAGVIQVDEIDYWVGEFGIEQDDEEGDLYPTDTPVLDQEPTIAPAA